MDYCIYYDNKNQKLLEILPKNISSNVKDVLVKLWNQRLAREILITLSDKGEMTVPEIKSRIGHSMSTLHENITKLAINKLIDYEMSYKGNKKKLIVSKVLCITKNSKFKSSFKRFFQGLWINSDNSKKIIKFLDSNPNKYFSIEEISIKTKIPVDEIEIALSNWESQLTRTFSDFLKEKPFEKKVMYKSK